MVCCVGVVVCCFFFGLCDNPGFGMCRRCFLVFMCFLLADCGVMVFVVLLLCFM